MPLAPRLNCRLRTWGVVSKTKHSKTKTEARSTQISKTKHPNLENEAPKTRKRSTLDRKRSTQNSKTKHPGSKTKTPKSRKRSALDRKRSTQISKTKTPKLENEAPESGGGSRCLRTSKGPQNPSQGFIRACQLFNWTYLDRIHSINFIIGLAILDTSYLNMHFSVHIHVYVDFKIVKRTLFKRK